MLERMKQIEEMYPEGCSVILPGTNHITYLGFGKAKFSERCFPSIVRCGFIVYNAKLDEYAKIVEESK